MTNAFSQELKTLYAMAFRKKSGDTHAEKLNSFYETQASYYDTFREKLLFGRDEMLKSTIPDGFSGRWIDIGGGTGRNIEVTHERLSQDAEVIIVDLCKPLIQQAQQKIKKYNWKNVSILETDARTFTPPQNKKADVITFSYSLSMIPDWFIALRNAQKILSEDGKIGVVDFFLPRKNEPSYNSSWIQRYFIPAWFSLDDVNLDVNHHRILRNEFNEDYFCVEKGRLPYVPFITPRYFIFTGKNKR